MPDPLTKCYKNLARYFKKAEFPIEDLSVASLVEKYRQFFKPKRVRLILLAESHVWTQKTETKSLVSYPLLPKILAKPPVNFVRFVYCLGYGENEIIHPPIESNPGTVQYWNLFGLCAGTGRQPKKNNSSLGGRLYWKIKTLESLKKKGIWLLDTSILAVYYPGSKRLPKSSVDKILLESWQQYTSRFCRDLPKEQIWCIGKELKDLLFGKNTSINWVYQPNAPLPKKTKETKLEALKSFITSEL